MRVTRFNRGKDLIFVDGRIWGPSGRIERLRLVLDTGAALTVVVPEILDQLGYSPRDAERITTMRSAVGEEAGYLTRVTRLSCLGFTVSDYRIHAHDLPDGWNIHGLLGLDFLNHFNYEIRSGEGRLLVERLAG